MYSLLIHSMLSYQLWWTHFPFGPWLWLKTAKRRVAALCCLWAVNHSTWGLGCCGFSYIALLETLPKWHPNFLIFRVTRCWSLSDPKKQPVAILIQLLGFILQHWIWTVESRHLVLPSKFTVWRFHTRISFKELYLFHANAALIQRMHSFWKERVYE